MFWTIVCTAAITLVLIVIAMNFSTPEKKLGRRVKHLYAAHDPQFRRDMGLLLGPSITHGNQVRALQNGDEIFPAMLHAVRQAQRHICFETYIYWSGDIGKTFAEALAERARAGVEVNVVLDWMGSLKMDDALVQCIEEAGANVQRYRPLRWYSLDRINNRTHRKLLIIDSVVGFTGGVGIADQWLGHAQNPEHWRDIHFQMTGPVVLQMMAAFNDNWIKTTGQVLTGERHFPAPQAQGELDAQLFLASPAGGSESMHLMYLMAIAASVKKLDLQAAYFVPDPLIIEALLAAHARGVQIRIMLPGQHIDSELVRLASKSGWGELLEQGIAIYEYQPTMLHNKMLIVDEEMVSVGSTNFDVRSFQLNDEASLNVYDTEFCRAMTQVFEADMQHCTHYTFARWQARPIKEKLLEKLTHPIRSQL